MTPIRFDVGQRVAILRSRALPAPAGVYRIVNALPRNGGPQQYRVRSEAENFDRVIDEVRLEAAVAEADVPSV